MDFFSGLEKQSSSFGARFTPEDYNASGGMMTMVWGPAMWHFLHTMSFNYPVKPSEEDKVHTDAFIRSIRHVLPCCYCRDNYEANLRSAGYSRSDLVDRDSFSRFMYRLHSEVNKRLGKTTTVSFEEVRDMYEHFRARCDRDNEDDKKDKKIEAGCVNPAAGMPTKCVMRIVPLKSLHKTFTVDNSCYNCS